MVGLSETVIKYYFAGSTRIAMRENGTLTWLISDHLGSTSVTADLTGTLLNTYKYTAFGEIRTWSGTNSTDYLYTGQRNEDEIGLYFYKARFYDPALGRFIQPDTLVPDPTSSGAYDRYAYVNNNPINFNDPSGNRPCEEASNCNSPRIITSLQTIQMISNEFSWKTMGNFDQKELSSIYAAGSTIRGFIDRSGGNGGSWIKKNLGLTQFEKNTQTLNQTATLGAIAFVWPYNTIRFGKDSLDSPLIIHELGHVLDNNLKGGGIPATVNGGGPADEMVRAMGGNPDACFPRLQCRGVLALQPVGKEQYYKTIAGENPWGRLDYANNGVSDDFAQTFMYTILGTNSDSPLRVDWMESYLLSLDK